jgi:hypothetical protein
VDRLPSHRPSEHIRINLPKGCLHSVGLRRNSGPLCERIYNFHELSTEIHLFDGLDSFDLELDLAFPNTNGTSSRQANCQESPQPPQRPTILPYRPVRQQILASGLHSPANCLPCQNLDRRRGPPADLLHWLERMKHWPVLGDPGEAQSSLTPCQEILAKRYSWTLHIYQHLCCCSPRSCPFTRQKLGPGIAGKS